MYNGIGLQTARGSGTNGYVQTNRFLVKPRVSKLLTDSSLKGFASGQGTAGLTRRPNRDILEHDRKRQIELKLLVLEDKLTDQGYTDNEISQKLDEARTAFEATDDALEDGEVGPRFLSDTKISDTQTHQIAARKERQMETLRAALGISVEGKSKNKLPAMLASDSEDVNDEGEPGNGRKGKKHREGNGDDTSDLRNVKKSHGNESAEDTINRSTRQKKQRSGRSHHGDSSDNDDSAEKVVKTSQKRLRRKTTSSESDDKDAKAKRKKKSSQKSITSRRRHDSDSSDSESNTDSSFDSDSDSGREHDRSLKKRDPREDSGSKYYKKDVKQPTKKPRKTLSSSESDESDNVKRKKNLPRKSNRSRRHESDSSSSESESDSRTDTKSNSDSGRAEKVDIDDCKGKKVEDRGRYEPRRYVELEKIQGKTGRTGERNDTRRHEYSKYDTDSSTDSDGHAKRALEGKNPNDNYRRFDGDLNDSRRVRKEHAHGDDYKSRHERDADGLDTLRKLEKDYQPKEEKMVNSNRVRTETNRSKRKTDDSTWAEQPPRKSRREDMNDFDYNYQAKHSHGSRDRSEYPISDRWGADTAYDYDMPQRGSGKDGDRQGRKHGREEEEATHRINDKDRERQQPEKNRREQDDRKGSKYDKDRDHDLAKRVRYDDSRSAGKRYDDDDDDDKHERKYSDRRSRR